MKEVLFLNQKVYPLDVIYGACYVWLDRAYILLDEKDGKIMVELESKSGKSIAGDFRNELINYAFYKKQAEKSSAVKELVLKEIFSQFGGLDDPEGIMIPWEEKYGAKGKPVQEKRSGKGSR
jgi:His-Xaa-Ser system protein HxsD